MPKTATADRVSREELLEFILPRHHAILVTTRTDARPQLSPVTCGVDPEGRVLEPGREGDIEVRGLTVMAGYLNRPEATREALRDGWLRTRDLGRLDARGRLTVLSRRTDLILRGGENIYPAELEAVLAAHPGVREAAVVGLTDARWGEVPVAFVVPREGASPLPELEAWCRQSLAGFKIPVRFLPLDSLPRNAMGKLERTLLRERARSA